VLGVWKNTGGGEKHWWLSHLGHIYFKGSTGLLRKHFGFDFCNPDSFCIFENRNLIVQLSLYKYLL
jgi:hypothetical protein